MRKRIFAGLLTFVLMINLMSAMAFAETTTTLPEAEVTKLSAMTLEANGYKILSNRDLVVGTVDCPLDIVVNFAAKDENETAYDKWYCDFYITITGLTDDSFTADECYLAGNYGTYGWIVIPMDGVEIKEEVTYPIVSTWDAKLTYKEVRTNVKNFIAAIHIAPEIFEANPDMEVNLELKMKNNNDPSEVLKIGETLNYKASDFVTFVAETNGKKYTSLENAVANANGSEIKLLTDVELSKAVEVTSNTVVDLAGKEITMPNDTSGDGAFHVTSGTLTINDSVGTGVVNGVGNNAYSMAIFAEGSNSAVVINGGTYTNVGAGSDDHYDLIYAKNDATVTINDGVFECETEKWTLNSKNDSVGSFVVNGGKFLGFDPSNTEIDDDSVSVAAGKHACADGNYYIVHGVNAVAEKSATCTATGTKAHYNCEKGKLFSDAAGTTEVTAASLVISAAGHSYGGYQSDSSNHWRACSCGSTTDTGAHKYKVGGECSTCGYQKAVEEDKTTSSESSSSSSSAGSTTTTQPTTTTQSATTTTTTTTTENTDTENTTDSAASESESEAEETPVEEVIVDTKIVEETASEEVKAVVTETVVVTEEKAAVTTETVEKVIEATEEGATVILPLTEAVTEEGQAVKEAEIPVEAIEKIAEAEVALTVEFEGVKVTFEPETLKAIAEQSNGGVIELRVVPVETEELHEEQQAALEEHDVQVRVSAQIFSDGKYVGDFKGGKARIAIPFVPEEGKAAEHHVAYYVADNGDMTKLPSAYADGHMIIETPHFSDFVIVYEEVAEVEEEAAAEETVTEEAVVEVVEEEAGLPILPIIIVVVAVIAVAAFFLTKKKNDEN